LLQATLNEFMGLGKPAWQEARHTLTRLLSSAEGLLRDNVQLREAAIVPQVRFGSAAVQAHTLTWVAVVVQPIRRQSCSGARLAVQLY
jgi:hypothetical protein